MDPTAILKLAIVASIVLMVLAIGLGAPAGSVRKGLSQPGRVARAMAAMFLFLPLVTLAITWWLPLEPAARIALLALAVSPMPPILPNKERKLGGGMDYALSIQVAASVTAMVVAPLFILLVGAVFGRDANVDPAGMARVILITVLLPLGAGIAIAHFAPELAKRLEKPVRLLGTGMLAIGLVIIIVMAAPGIAQASTWPTLVAVVLMTVAGLALGHWLGGPEIGNRHALAAATASRHPGVAIGLASAADLASRQPIVAVILIYLLMGVALGAIHMRWAKQQA